MREKDVAYAVLVILGDSTRERRYFKVGGSLVSSGDLCVVETERGEGFGEVIRGPELIDPEELGYPLYRVIREFTDDDRERVRVNREKEEEDLKAAQEMADKQGLPMKMANAEYSFDRSCLIFHFTSLQRVDFRDFLKELAAHFKTRIELRQIGPREEVQMKGGVGRCGRTVCCTTFLKNPESISMKAVYEQELFVPPERVTGICGRLICCLKFEHQNYIEVITRLPHLGAKVRCNDKEGKVIGHNIFNETTIIETEDGRKVEVPNLSRKDVI